MHQIAAAPGPFGADPAWVAVILFVVTYLLVIADRINRSIIALTKSPVLTTPILESLRNADRNSAMALGFWVFGMRRNLRILTELRFRAWVKNSRGSLELRNGRATKTWLFTASYGSYPAQSFA